MLEECTIPRQKIKKKFWGGVEPPPQIPAVLGRGHSFPKPSPLGACGASTLVPSALDMCSPFENPGSTPGL